MRRDLAGKLHNLSDRRGEDDEFRRAHGFCRCIEDLGTPGLLAQRPSDFGRRAQMTTRRASPRAWAALATEPPSRPGARIVS